jgi:hypothetical protein
MLLIFGLGVLSFLQRESIAALRKQMQAQREQLDSLAAENKASFGRMVEGRIEPQPPREGLSELLRLRNEVSLLRKLTNAAPHVVEHATVGNDLGVRYDPLLWKPLSSVNGSDDQSTTWESDVLDGIQITVSKRSASKNESQFKEDWKLALLSMGDPPELIAERHEFLENGDWFVLEFRNAHRRPPWTELSYFLEAAAGHITVFIVGEELAVSVHRPEIQAFLREIRPARARAPARGE